MPETTNPQPDRRERYAAAIRETDGWVLDDGQHMIDAVIAVADAEQADLATENAKLIRWHREDGDALAEMRGTIARLRAALGEAAEVAVRAARGCGESEAGQYAASVAAGVGKELRRLADEPAPGPSRVAGEAPQPETQAVRDGVLRVVADWYASSEGRDVLIEDLAAAGYPLPDGEPAS